MDVPWNLWKKLSFSLCGFACLLSMYLIVFQQRRLHNDNVRSLDRGTSHTTLKGGLRLVEVANSIEEHYDMKESGACNDKCQDIIQDRRLRKAAHICSEVDNRTMRPIDQSFVDRLNHIFVLDKFKVLFCYVPKVACTNWKRTILQLLDMIDLNERISHLHIHGLAAKKVPTLKNFNSKEAAKRLNSYKKILFVREPMSRLISAYRDKLETPHNGDAKAFRKLYIPKIKGIDRANIRKGTDVEYNTTFYEFISYVGNTNNKLSYAGEEHWRTVDEMCRPCSVQYDFIGRMETLERDRDYALRHIFRVDPEIYRHHASTNPTNSSRASIVQDYLSKIPESTLRTLYERFRVDFDAFGYVNPISLPAEIPK